MTLSERLRDTAALGPVTAPGLMRDWHLSRKHAENLIRLQVKCGVLVPMPGRYPRHYRLALPELNPPPTLD